MAPKPLWEIPGERTKNKQSHIVPLSPTVRNVIRGMPRTGDLVFTTSGETPVSGFGRPKGRIDARIAAMREAAGLAPISDWTLHDLRRTMVTVMNERLGVAPHVVEAVVNHMSGLAKAGVAGVYNRALYLEDRRAALRAWTRFVDRFSKRAPANGRFEAVSRWTDTTRHCYQASFDGTKSNMQYEAHLQVWSAISSMIRSFSSGYQWRRRAVPVISSIR